MLHLLQAGQIEDHRLKTLIDQNKEMERELQNEQNENKQASAS